MIVKQIVSIMNEVWVLRILGLAHLLTIVLLREYRRVLDLIAVRVAKRLRTLIYSIESYSTMRRSLDIPNAIILCMSAVES